jgi:Flp pilus assembly protein TadG
LSRRERAQVLPLTAVMMIALLGAVALVVDVGLLWITQRELQKTADSAAMAGVILLPNQSAAEQQAAWYAQQNFGIAAHFCSAKPTATITPGEHAAVGGGTFYTLTATVQCSAGFTFGQIVSNQPTDLATVPNDCDCVRASATAVIGSNRSPTCPAPLAVTDINEGIAANGTPVFAGDPGATWVDMARNGSGYTFGQLVELHVDNAGATNGNFHAIQFGTQSGAGPYRDQLANKCSGTPNIQPGDYVTTQPGDMTGPTEQGLQARGLVPCTGPSQPALCTRLNYPNPHPQFSLACPDNPIDLSATDDSGVLKPDGTVKRGSLCLTPVVVVVPLAFSLSGGRSQIQVEGFAEFFIAGWSKRDKSVWGMFVKGAPTLGELGGYDKFGTIIVRLIR